MDQFELPMPGLMPAEEDNDTEEVESDTMTLSEANSDEAADVVDPARSHLRHDLLQATLLFLAIELMVSRAVVYVAIRY